MADMVQTDSSAESPSDRRREVALQILSKIYEVEPEILLEHHKVSESNCQAMSITHNNLDKFEPDHVFRRAKVMDGVHFRKWSFATIEHLLKTIALWPRKVITFVAISEYYNQHSEYRDDLSALQSSTPVQLKTMFNYAFQNVDNWINRIQRTVGRKKLPLKQTKKEKERAKRDKMELYRNQVAERRRLAKQSSEANNAENGWSVPDDAQTAVEEKSQSTTSLRAVSSDPPAVSTDSDQECDTVDDEFRVDQSSTKHSSTTSRQHQRHHAKSPFTSRPPKSRNLALNVIPLKSCFKRRKTPRARSATIDIEGENGDDGSDDESEERDNVELNSQSLYEKTSEILQLEAALQSAVTYAERVKASNDLTNHLLEHYQPVVVSNQTVLFKTNVVESTAVAPSRGSGNSDALFHSSESEARNRRIKSIQPSFEGLDEEGCVDSADILMPSHVIRDSVDSCGTITVHIELSQNAVSSARSVSEIRDNAAMVESQLDELKKVLLWRAKRIRGYASNSSADYSGTGLSECVKVYNSLDVSLNLLRHSEERSGHHTYPLSQMFVFVRLRKLLRKFDAPYQLRDHLFAATVDNVEAAIQSFRDDTDEPGSADGDQLHVHTQSYDRTTAQELIGGGITWDYSEDSTDKEIFKLLSDNIHQLLRVFQSEFAVTPGAGDEDCESSESPLYFDTFERLSGGLTNHVLPYECADKQSKFQLSLMVVTHMRECIHDSLTIQFVELSNKVDEAIKEVRSVTRLGRRDGVTQVDGKPKSEKARGKRRR